MSDCCSRDFSASFWLRNTRLSLQLRSAIGCRDNFWVLLRLGMLNMVPPTAIVYGQMGTTPNSEEPTPKKPQAENTVLAVVGDIADTTWRIFFPIVGFAVLGLYIDMSIAMTPWITLLLTAVGSAVAALLVRRQINRITDE